MVCFHVPMHHQSEAPKLVGFGQEYVGFREGPLERVQRFRSGRVHGSGERAG